MIADDELESPATTRERVESVVLGVRGVRSVELWEGPGRVFVLVGVHWTRALRKRGRARIELDVLDRLMDHGAASICHVVRSRYTWR